MNDKVVVSKENEKEEKPTVEKKDKTIVENKTEPKITKTKKEDSLPKVFVDAPERVGNPRSPLKEYLVFDTDMADAWLKNANLRVNENYHYAVILDDISLYPGNANFLLYCVMNAVRQGGTLYVGNAYVGNEFLDSWDKHRKEGQYVPYTKP